LASLGHPSKFQRVSRLGSVTARPSSSGRQPNFATLNRGRHLYSAGRPSRWALAHILVSVYFGAARSLTATLCGCLFSRICSLYSSSNVHIVLCHLAAHSGDASHSDDAALTSCDRCRVFVFSRRQFNEGTARTGSSMNWPL